MRFHINLRKFYSDTIKDRPMNHCLLDVEQISVLFKIKILSVIQKLKHVKFSS